VVTFEIVEVAVTQGPVPRLTSSMRVACEMLPPPALIEVRLRRVVVWPAGTV